MRAWILSFLLIAPAAAAEEPPTRVEVKPAKSDAPAMAPARAPLPAGIGGRLADGRRYAVVDGRLRLAQDTMSEPSAIAETGEYDLKNGGKLVVAADGAIVLEREGMKVPLPK